LPIDTSGAAHRKRTRPARPAPGRILTVKSVWSPQRRNRRDIQVYLPPSYARSQQRYPVVYMHDGQNLFDEETAFAGAWRVDRHMERLSRVGIEAIVVGIPNMGAERLDEYSPFRDRQGGGHGEAYLAFLIDTLKPLVDRRFRTRSGPMSTGLLGSSMGGFISLYGFFRHPEVFGFIGVMSPSLWYAGGAILEYIEQAPFSHGKVYLDVGTAEGDRAVEDVHRLHALLVRKGYGPGESLLYVEDEGAGHAEAAWAHRLATALYFLLPAPRVLPVPAPRPKRAERGAAYPGEGYRTRAARRQ
jgi:predicted alpha/beta superfamily hydrolase